MNERALVRALQELMSATLRIEAKLDALIVASGTPVPDMIDGAPDPATGRPIEYGVDFESRLVLRRGGLTHGKVAPMIGLSSLLDLEAGSEHGRQDHSVRGRSERGGSETEPE